jgi:hypothetical protein
VSQFEPAPPTDADLAEQELERALGTEDERPGELADPVSEGGPAADPTGIASGAIAAAGPPSFTSAEKLRAVLDAAQRGLAADSSSTARMMRRAIAAAGRFGLLEQLRLPSWEEPEEWDQRLALAIGLGLELMSDGVELDIEAARGAARQALHVLFSNVDER